MVKVGLSLQELIVYGITGLIKASEKYDETQGFKFLSYAVWWIQQSMLNAIKKCDIKSNNGQNISVFLLVKIIIIANSHIIYEL